MLMPARNRGAPEADISNDVQATDALNRTWDASSVSAIAIRWFGFTATREIT
jgi:hypothetical protein